MFMAPVFYPLSSVPPKLQAVIMLNPLTFVIDQFRTVAIWGGQLNWVGLLIYAVVAYVIASLGLLWFQKTRKGFADVL
jgi:lipopolysaccharide transport system permease protein